MLQERGKLPAVLDWRAVEGRMKPNRGEGSPVKPRLALALVGGM